MELQGKSIPSSGKEPGHFYTRQLADLMVGLKNTEVAISYEPSRR